MASGDLVFTVVDANRWDWLGQGLPFTEMDWLMPEEIRLLSSIFLCQTFDGPKLRMYPDTYPVFLEDDHADIASHALLTDINEALLDGLDHPGMSGDFSSFRRGFEYYLVDTDEFELDRQEAIFSGIDIQDHLLLRGLSTLMKSSMLSGYSEFSEEAIMVLFVSLETSLRLVLRQLQRQGVAEPTVTDAANWIYETFDKPLGHPRRGEGYFSEFYEKRVMTLHPESRYGINVIAPLFHDDQSYLFDLMVALYAYLVTGDHSSEYRGWLQQQAEVGC